MVATNHALTGAAIGLISGRPAIALPLALLSHFICDALPHYGSANPNLTIKSRRFRNYLIIDASLCFLLVVALAYYQPVHWQLAAVCAFVAAAPDFWWLNRFLTVRSSRTWQPNWFSLWAQAIQWFQRPIGAVVEVAWFVGAIAVLQPFFT